MHFSRMERHRSRMERDLANREDARKQENAYLLQISSQSALCGLVRCPCAKSISRSLTNPVIPFQHFPSDWLDIHRSFSD